MILSVIYSFVLGIRLFSTGRALEARRHNRVMGMGRPETHTFCPQRHNHLERVVFEDYWGRWWQQQMAKFLHENNSRFLLETMEFHCMDHAETRPFGMMRPASARLVWVRKQREILCLALDSRASRDVCFLFLHASDSPSFNLHRRVLQVL
jgi:hypothetical protein